MMESRSADLFPHDGRGFGYQLVNAILSLIPSFGACTKSCFVPKYRSVVCTEAWPRSNWICSSSPPAARHSLAHVRRQSWGAIPGTPAASAYGLMSCHTTFSEGLGNSFGNPTDS